MLIRSDNNELVEYPDDLIVLMLASPVHGDLDEESDWSIKELNCLIHAMLGFAHADALTLEQTIEKIRETYTPFGNPTPANQARAEALVRFYNETLTEDEIGYSDRETIRAVFPFQNTAQITGAENVIDQEMKPVGATTAPALTHEPAPSR